MLRVVSGPSKGVSGADRMPYRSPSVCSRRSTVNGAKIAFVVSGRCNANSACWIHQLFQMNANTSTGPDTEGIALVR
jgi:hypothetical protein